MSLWPKGVKTGRTVVWKRMLSDRVAIRREYVPLRVVDADVVAV